MRASRIRRDLSKKVPKEIKTDTQAESNPSSVDESLSLDTGCCMSLKDYLSWLNHDNNTWYTAIDHSLALQLKAEDVIHRLRLMNETGDVDEEKVSVLVSD